MRRAHLAAALACCLQLVSAAPLAAEVYVFVESHVGERPKDAARLTSPVSEELTQFGYLGTVQTTGEPYERTISRPGLATWRSAAEIAVKAELGYEAYISGRFSEAVALLVPLLSEIRLSPAIVAWQPRIRHAMFKASVATAISLERLGRAEAGAAEMDELLRSYPDEAVLRATHGPEAEALYAKAKRRSDQQGRGTLHIIAQAPTQIFINERLVAASGDAIVSLAPGVYRVYTQQGSLPGRLYTVELRASSERTLQIYSGYDQLIHTSPYWTGFLFPDESTRARLEPAAALRFARELGATKMIVLAFTAQKGQPILIGAALDATTQTIVRTASLPLVPDPAVETLQALAQYLAAGGPTPGFSGDGSAHFAIDADPQVFAGARPALAAASTTPAVNGPEGARPRSKRWLPYVALGGAATSAVAATYFFINDGKGTCDASACVYHYEYTAAAFGSTALGAGLTALAIVGFAKGWHRRTRVQAITASYTGNAVSVGLGGRF
ncbi:MAG: hypothetical protein IPL79_02575 [Myxococcales bacterium]|nr:hypothetical protein [Myxococcales bacterium]